MSASGLAVLEFKSRNTGEEQRQGNCSLRKNIIEQRNLLFKKGRMAGKQGD
jgi:hypothetical protein